ncbi:POZ domain-containing protein [Heliocybe sulcata]|uniref:Elongin-C n=1 Tax=Heliocybe sulcata TaxID=5364 RepID=A0A5C3N299_9AGAM|nr:POZ domain-containing protein [Heliocybe sulcata]
MPGDVQMSDDAQAADDWVLITAPDGFSFMVKRKVALISGTLRNMLSTESNFREAIQSQCDIPDTRAAVVEKLCEYMAYKAQYENTPPKEEIPDFTERIPPELALEL